MVAALPPSAAIAIGGGTRHSGYTLKRRNATACRRGCEEAEGIHFNVSLYCLNLNRLRIRNNIIHNEGSLFILSAGKLHDLISLFHG
jgi:hypothetical protein